MAYFEMNFGVHRGPYRVCAWRLARGQVAV